MSFGQGWWWPLYCGDAAFYTTSSSTQQEKIASFNPGCKSAHSEEHLLRWFGGTVDGAWRLYKVWFWGWFIAGINTTAPHEVPSRVWLCSMDGELIEAHICFCFTVACTVCICVSGETIHFPLFQQLMGSFLSSSRKKLHIKTINFEQEL